jgi:hypothetical protein
VKATWIVIVGTAFLVTACGKSPEQKAQDKQSAAIRDVCKKEVAFAVSIHAESQFNGLKNASRIERAITRK